ncbi:MAG TPA: PEP-CTERM sorting domain-containing protein [Phycisphaerae bacterium]|nr:PEP-CTERM sorting domain-containing protein [Phycisphaerae bacterium]
MSRRVCALGIVLVGAVGPVCGDILVYETPAGSEFSGESVWARATFTTTADQVTIVLENLQADQKSVGQCLSGLRFVLSTGQSSGNLSSSSGVERTVASDGTYSDGGTVSVGWQMSVTGQEFFLTLLGTAISPTHTILGPPNASNVYARANNSITGGSHNPFLGESATFVLSVPGVTAESGISSVTFCFNTSPGSEIYVPEPAALGLLSLGGACLLLRGRRRQA